MCCLVHDLFQGKCSLYMTGCPLRCMNGYIIIDRINLSLHIRTVIKLTVGPGKRTDHAELTGKEWRFISPTGPDTFEINSSQRTIFFDSYFYILQRRRTMAGRIE